MEGAGRREKGGERDLDSVASSPPCRGCVGAHKWRCSGLGLSWPLSCACALFSINQPLGF